MTHGPLTRGVDDRPSARAPGPPDDADMARWAACARCARTPPVPRSTHGADEHLGRPDQRRSRVGFIRQECFVPLDGHGVEGEEEDEEKAEDSSKSARNAVWYVALDRGSARLALSAGIEIAYDDAEHLTGELGLALGHRHARTQLGIGIGQTPVPPRNGRQASAAAANEPRAFRRGDALLKAGSWLPTVGPLCGSLREFCTRCAPLV